MTRFKKHYLFFTGVEKKIKFWCPFNITKSDQHDTYSNRRLNGRQDLFWMLQASSDFGQDCEHESTEENLSMLAFFDSLGMISHKMSLITIFGHKHFRQKFDIFHEKISTVSDFGSYLVSKFKF